MENFKIDFGKVLQILNEAKTTEKSSVASACGGSGEL